MSPSATNLRQIAELEGFLLDLDGTLYLGDQLLPCAVEFLHWLQQRGKKFLFLTNNSSKTPEQYAQKLQAKGIDARSDQVFTSLDGTLAYLRTHHIRSIYLLAPPSVCEYVQNQGFLLTDKSPERVVIAYDTTLTYEKLTKAAILIQQGVPYLATHPDRGCPSPQGMLPDCGAFLALFERATGISPEVVLGKPHPFFAQGALEKLGTSPETTVMVGDRLYTDMAMGQAAQVHTLLVFTGETQPSDLEGAPLQPTWTVKDLCELLEAISSLP